MLLLSVFCVIIALSNPIPIWFIYLFLPGQWWLRVSFGINANGHSGVWGSAEDRFILLAQDNETGLQEEETDLDCDRRRRAGQRARAHVRLPAVQWEGVQALVEMCPRASRLLPVTDAAKGAVGAPKLLPHGLPIPVLGQNPIPDNGGGPNPPHSPVRA